MAEAANSIKPDVRLVEARYLSILQAKSLEQLEDRVVSTLVDRMSEQISQLRLPIRLSKIAADFLIEPKPLAISGSHDGELGFDTSKKRFVIKLCGAARSDEQTHLTRQRFTYAHEMAHRFFFIEQSDESYVRAIDLLTADLPVAQKIRHRRLLNGIEERLCNQIARRVLIPDSLLLEHCDLHEWFNRKEGLYRSLSRAAAEFGVSRECLIVRIGSAIRRGVMIVEDSKCLIVVAKTRGPITQRGDETLRINACFFPRKLNERIVNAPFPGFELRRFGVVAEEFFESGFTRRTPSAGEMDVPLALTSHKRNADAVATHLRGWWKSHGNNPDFRRLYAWGTLVI